MNNRQIQTTAAIGIVTFLLLSLFVQTTAAQSQTEIDRLLPYTSAMLSGRVSLSDTQAEELARLLNDPNLWVRAMAEWAITTKIGRENHGRNPRWNESSEIPWFQKWLAVPLASRIEMDWVRQAVYLGIYKDPDELRSSVDAMIDRVRRAGRSNTAAIETIRKAMEITEDVEQLRVQWIDARRELRPIVFEIAQLDFDEIILYTRFSYHYKENVSGAQAGWAYKPGGDIILVDGLEQPRSSKSLIKGRLGAGHVHGMDLWFDAKRVAFGWAGQSEWPPRFDLVRADFEQRNSTTPPHLYELDVNDGEITQLTDHNFWTDIEPTYCPDGSIVFASDRSAHSPSCDVHVNDQTDLNLYRLSPDRTLIRRVTNQKDVDMHPHLLDNGLVGYLRWEYQERHFWEVHSLWTVRPDGTMADAAFKQHLASPLSVRDVRSVPGTGKLIAVAAGHHDVAKGALVLLNPSAGINAADGIEVLTKGIILKEGDLEGTEPVRDGGVQDAGGYYTMPYAISEKAFLTSYAYTDPKLRKGYPFYKNYGIYLIDSYGNKELIYRHPLHSSYRALPFRKRMVPRAMPDMTDFTKNYATCVIPDVYEGMDGVDRGTIKHIRISEALPWPIVPGEGVKRWDLSGRWCPVRVIGTVPVEADGSAHFKVPAADNASVYFQALDEKQMEICRMRSSVSFQPGEHRSCNGCHESRTDTPSHKQGLAATRAPDMPEAPAWGCEKPIGYMSLIQPIFDRHCVACHSDQQPAGGLCLTGENAYENALKFISRSSNHSDCSITKPLQFGSHKSRLITRLLEEDTPCKSNLPEEDWITLVTWVDANAPFEDRMLSKRTSDGRTWVWEHHKWKHPWAAAEQTPAMGDYIPMPNNKWRQQLSGQLPYPGRVTFSKSDQ